MLDSLDVSETLVILDSTDTCAEITRLQRERVFCIKMQSRSDRAVDSYIARMLGYHTGLPAADRKRLMKQAAGIRKAAEDGEDQIRNDHHSTAVLAAARALIIASAVGRAEFDKIRAHTEKKMRARARKLPVWGFVEDVKGLSDLGLAVIVGEAGRPLSDYRSWPALWKRLGLAVINGRRQGSPGSGASADDWKAHGYNPGRRAQIWAFTSDTMFRAQWAGDKDEDGKNPTKTKKPIAVAAHPRGSYGEIYAARKASTIARGWTPKHADNDARRIMTKRLIRDLWSAWRETRIMLANP